MRNKAIIAIMSLMATSIAIYLMFTWYDIKLLIILFFWQVSTSLNSKL